MTRITIYIWFSGFMFLIKPQDVILMQREGEVGCEDKKRKNKRYIMSVRLHGASYLEFSKEKEKGV